MTPLEWTPKLLTHPAFDDDHQELVQMVNDIETLGLQNPSPKQSADAVVQLLEKMQQHTKEEETLMHKTAYTRLIPHKIEHDHFISELQDLIYALRDGKEKLTNDSTLFIRTWFYEHIVSVDKVFTQWLAQKDLMQG